MTNQRKRALNIIRTKKNVAVLNLVKLEKIKVEYLKKELNFLKEPEFISYSLGTLKVLDGLSQNQLMKIELELLFDKMSKAELSLDNYHQELDLLIKKLDNGSDVDQGSINNDQRTN
jgi:CRISPR/Cas system-associated endonuclease Cas3-HD